MDINNFKMMEPMKYWAPPKGSTIIEDIFNNPEYYKEYLGMIKYDGEWCMAIRGTDNNILFRSRNISKVTGEYGDKTELLPHLVEEMMNFPENTILLGELCFEDITKTAKDVGTILRCKAPKAIERQKNNKLYFRVFDCLYTNNEDITQTDFENRLLKSINLVQTYSKEYVKSVEYFNYSEFNIKIQDIWSKGGEGALLVKKTMKYIPGSRTARESIKVKKSLGELELIVVNTIEPNKIYEGKEIDNWKFWEDGKPVTKPYYYKWANGVEVLNKDTKIKVTSGLSDDDREWLVTEEAIKAIKNGELYAVVTGMEMLDSGSIRHPQLLNLRLHRDM